MDSTVSVFNYITIACFCILVINISIIMFRLTELKHICFQILKNASDIKYACERLHNHMISLRRDINNKQDNEKDTKEHTNKPKKYRKRRKKKPTVETNKK